MVGPHRRSPALFRLKHRKERKKKRKPHSDWRWPGKRKEKGRKNPSLSLTQSSVERERRKTKRRNFFSPLPKEEKGFRAVTKHRPREGRKNQSVFPSTTPHLREEKGKKKRKTHVPWRERKKKGGGVKTSSPPVKPYHSPQETRGGEKKRKGKPLRSSSTIASFPVRKGGGGNRGLFVPNPKEKGKKKGRKKEKKRKRAETLLHPYHQREKKRGLGLQIFLFA